MLPRPGPPHAGSPAPRAQQHHLTTAARGGDEFPGWLRSYLLGGQQTATEAIMNDGLGMAGLPGAGGTSDATRPAVVDRTAWQAKLDALR